MQQFLSGGSPGSMPAAQAQSALQNYQSGPQPFSPAWYAQHPHAWQYTHPHADAVAAASATGIAAWLAYGTSPYPSTSTSTTVIYESSALAPMPAETQSPSNSLVSAPSGQPDWLALGVYELKPAPSSPASQVVQLWLNREGIVRGVYFDHLSGASQNVTGAVDQPTQSVRWSLESNPEAAFATSLKSLTQPQGEVRITLPNGMQTWVIQRTDNP